MLNFFDAHLSMYLLCSTPSEYREGSIEHAEGNETLASLQYEAAAKEFMLATIEATKRVRPGCSVGW